MTAQNKNATVKLHIADDMLAVGVPARAIRRAGERR
jgi:serine acetyltransferase